MMHPTNYIVPSVDIAVKRFCTIFGFGNLWGACMTQRVFCGVGDIFLDRVIARFVAIVNANINCYFHALELHH